MNQKKTEAIKETLVTVFTGLVVNWPISLGFLYLCIDVLDLSTLNTSIVITVGMTVDANVIISKIDIPNSCAWYFIDVEKLLLNSIE